MKITLTPSTKLRLLKFTLIFLLCAVFCAWIWHIYKQDKIDREKLANLIQEEVFKQTEYGYFEGQKDAMNGDWRIKRITDNLDTCYMWTKNCWDNSTRKVQYVPVCGGKKK